MADTQMIVLVNDEEQYSLWPSYLAVPGGWRDTGIAGSHDECVGYVETVWTDMRPKSLREHMQEDARRSSGKDPGKQTTNHTNGEQNDG